MKAIVVYYSLEGNTKYVADHIKDNLGADTLRLEPVKEYPKGNASKYFWGGKSVVFGETPKLSAYEFSAAEYDVVIIGTPVWAGSFTPPIKTFLKENALLKNKVAFYACNSGGEADKCFDKLKKELSGCEVVATLSLADPDKNKKDENIMKIKAFCDKINQSI